MSVARYQTDGHPATSGSPVSYLPGISVEEITSLPLMLPVFDANTTDVTLKNPALERSGGLRRLEEVLIPGHRGTVDPSRGGCQTAAAA
jgi:hypothetical protein